MEFTEEDLIRVRQETPGLGNRVHLDNCGASLMSQPVVDTMRAFLDREVSLGGYVAQEQHSEALSLVYNSLSRLFGGSKDDFALTSSAVDAWTKAFYSIPMEQGDNIVTMYNEYCSNYVACLQRAERDRVEIRIARANSDGRLDLDHLASLIDERTRVVSVTHVPTSSGQIANVSKIGEVIRETDAIFLLDACQAVGHVLANFEEIGCHIATGTSRKFLRGPRGVGFMYVDEETRARLDPVILTNQSAAWDGIQSYKMLTDARMFEDWERSCMLHLGFGAALDYLYMLDPSKVYREVCRKAGQVRDQLFALPNVEPVCKDGAAGAIITFNVKSKSAEEVKSIMERRDIAVQVSSIYHTRIDFSERGLDTAVRISPHYYNSEEEINRFLNAVDSI